MGDAADTAYTKLRAILQGEPGARPQWQEQIAKLNKNLAEGISERENLAQKFGAPSFRLFSNEIDPMDVEKVLSRSTAGKKSDLLGNAVASFDKRFGLNLGNEANFIRAAEEAAQNSSAGLGKFSTGFSLASPLLGGAAGTYVGMNRGDTTEDIVKKGLFGLALGAGAQSPAGRQLLYKAPEVNQAVQEGAKRIITATQGMRGK